ncbi:MAG: permease-like cell division protein FtsX [Bacillota bacterium]|nr:permease-like cell division protein FtsX [Bacillota bacterium]
MKTSTIKYYISTALKNLKRNFTLSSASAATVAASLFILGVFLVAIANINLIVKDVGSTLQIQIFIKDDATYQQQRDIEGKLKTISGITNIEYLDKQESLNKVKKIFGDKNKDLTEGYSVDNPFSCSYIVKVEKPEVITTVINTVQNMDGIDEVSDERKLVNQFLSVTRTLQWIGLGVFAILICVSVFLIENTIKLTVFSRRREIGIMKYIGATDWFIRWPFIFEGMMIGIIGSLLSTIILFFSYKAVFSNLSKQFITMKFLSPGFVGADILLPFILAGVLIGSVGSILSLRKFLIV